MHKTANISKLWQPVWGATKKISDLSVWRALQRASERKVANGGGRGWRALGSTSKIMAGPTGMAMGAYGIAGSMLPNGLPGSDIMSFAGMPGWTSAMAAPGAIKSLRMLSGKNQSALKSDVEEGARRAGDDMMTMIHTRPDVFSAPGAYENAMREYGIWGGDNAPVKAPGVGDFLFNHDTAMQSAVHNKLQDFTKNAAAGLLGKALGMGGNIMRALTIPAMGLSAYAIGDAALRKKPYDPEMAMREGYMGAQGVIGRKLDGMGNMQRWALRADPSLAVGEIEKRFPGTTSRWEAATGMAHKPGWLSDIMNNWKKGGRQSFFTSDAAGNRHYIE